MFQIQQKFCILIHQASVLIFVLTILTFKVALFWPNIYPAEQCDISALLNTASD